VRRDGQVEGLGQVTDLHERGDAAAVGDVGLGERHAARGDQVPKLGEGVQVLARGDRQAALAHDADVARHVVGARRLLEPDRIELAQRARGPDRLVDAPAHVGVHHQRELGAEVRAHRSHALDVLPQRGAADLHLDGAEAAREVVVRLPQQRVHGQVQVDPARIARHARIETAQRAPERDPLAARAQIPQGDVHGRDGERLGTAAAAVVQRPPHGLPQVLDALGLASGQHRGEVAREQGVHGGAASPDRVGVADAHRAVGVVQPDRQQLEAADGPVRAVRKDGRQRNEVVVGLDVVNLHGRIGREPGRLSGARQEVIVGT
jgi:hypothetical protein